MTEPTDEDIQQILRRAMPPVKETELQRDLWGSMLRKLDERHLPAGWFDWALVGLLAFALLWFPQIFPVLLYWL